MNKCNDMTQYDNLNEYSKNEQKILERNKGENYEA